MTLVRYNPIRTMRPFGFDSFLDDFFGRTTTDLMGVDNSFNMPSVNVIEHEDSYEIEVAAPGLKKDDFRIEMENDQLILSAEHREEREENKGEYKRREFNYSSFKRSFQLSDDIDTDKIEAKYEDGILRLFLGKKDTSIKKAPKTISVK